MDSLYCETSSTHGAQNSERGLNAFAEIAEPQFRVQQHLDEQAIELENNEVLAKLESTIHTSACHNLYLPVS